MKLFQQCISEFSVCKHCKSTKSKLQMYSNPSSQYALKVLGVLSGTLKGAIKYSTFKVPISHP